MKVEYVSPFVGASINVVQTLIGTTPNRGQLSARPQVFTSQQVNIVCGVTGDVEGQVIYGMSVVTADKIASAMCGTQIVTFDQLAASAIAELGNMISGNSATLLSQQGYVVDITPPTIVKGTNVKITTLDIPALVIPIEIGDLGHIEINVSLQERAKRSAA
ncbi:MAG: chemotaxis protein CheX [Fimbriimonadaceae bacterium]|nr:chemotaxis protein CheX [Fimbriimonadaceae bacterium]